MKEDVANMIGSAKRRNGRISATCINPDTPLCAGFSGVGTARSGNAFWGS